MRVLAAWAYAATLLLLIVVNALNPGQLSSALPEAAWVLLLLLPVAVVCGLYGTLRDRVAVAVVVLLPVPWAAAPLRSPSDRHRTEYYDTYAVMATVSVIMALLSLSPPPKPTYSFL